MGEATTSPRRLAAKDRQAQALALRRQGAHFSVIARQLDYGSPASAFKAVRAALVERVTPDADALRAQEGAKLDQIRRAAWPKAMAGDTDSLHVLLRVSEQYCRLFGLNMPAKLDIGVGIETSLVARLIEAANTVGVDPAELIDKMVLRLEAQHEARMVDDAG